MGCRSGSGFLFHLVGINCRDGNVFDLRNGIYRILHRLGITARSNEHVKAALKLLLLKILGRGNTL